jgi:hypothetical protein
LGLVSRGPGACLAAIGLSDPIDIDLPGICEDRTFDPVRPSCLPEDAVGAAVSPAASAGTNGSFLEPPRELLRALVQFWGPPQCSAPHNLHFGAFIARISLLGSIPAATPRKGTTDGADQD